MTIETSESSVTLELFPATDIVYMRRMGAYGPENNALM